MGNNKKNPLRRSAALLLALALLVTAAVGGTIAYVLVKSATVNNAFQPGTVPITIIIDDGADTVTVKNDGNVPVYIRMAVVGNWVRSDDTSVCGLPHDEIAQLDAYEENNWVLHTDGYFYYTKAVYPGDTTRSLTQSAVAPPADAADGCSARYQFAASSIQAEGGNGTESAVVDAWGVDPTTLS